VAKSYENCHVLYNDPDKGRGRALKLAFRYILEKGMKPEGIVTVNGYDQFDIRYILEC
jgi:hypothetical protein